MSDNRKLAAILAADPSRATDFPAATPANVAGHPPFTLWEATIVLRIFNR